MRLLIVEDDPMLADGLARSLRQVGFATDTATNGESADHMLVSQAYDLVILDIGLPKFDGLEVLRRLRRRQNPAAAVPVLILTARDALEDRVKGLDLGADDYMTKPFELPELEARVRALVRRGKFGSSARLTHGRLTFDTVGRQALIDDAPLELSAREISVLESLLVRAGRVVSKEQIADQLTGWGEEVGPNAIEVYVHRLRKKLEPASVKIRTVRGLGYVLEKNAGAPPPTT
jgi:two-component system OmpR family response regulator